MEWIFDWLRTRIKEESANGFGTNGAFFSYLPTVTAEKIINEAEAKWEADCCEWRLSTNADYISPTYETKCGKAIAEIRVSCNFAFCPYCGKPIKISEVE